MEVPAELLAWLESTQLFTDVPLAELDAQRLSQEMVNGLAAGVYFDALIRRIVQATQTSDLPAGDLPYPSPETPDQTLENWSQLQLLLSQLSIPLPTETLPQLSASDPQATLSLLTQLQAFDTKSKASGKRGVYLDSLDTEKALFQADSCIEFFILSFCTNFSLKPKQGAGLLTKNNEILARVIAKGLKGDFDPVINWLQGVYQNTERLSDLVANESEKGSLGFVLTCVRPGLLSKNLEVVQWTCKVFSRLALDLEERGQLKEVWAWFISDKGILSLLVDLCKKFKSDISDIAVEMMLHISQFNLLQLFSYYLKDLLSDPMQYFAFVHDLLPALKATEWVREEILSSRVLNYWLESALREADAYTSQARITVLIFLSSLWKEFFSTMEEGDTVLQLIVGSLKNCFRDTQTLVRATAVSVTFELLDYLIDQKHGKAIIVYQALILMTIELDPAEAGREVLTSNLTRLLSSVPSLPISLLLEPYIKRILTAEPEYPLDTTDYSLFTAIAAHSRLQVQDAIQITDLLGKVYMTEPVSSRAVLPAFCMAIARFVDTLALQEYLALYCKYSLNQALAAQQRVSTIKKRGNKGPIEEETMIELLTCRRVRDLAFEIIAWILQLQNEALNEKLKQILVAYELYYEEDRKQQCRGLIVLLGEFGDPQLLLQSAVPESIPEVMEEPSPVLDLLNAEEPTTNQEDLENGQIVPLDLVPVEEQNQIVPKRLPFPWKRAFHDIKQAKEKAKRRLQRLENTPNTPFHRSTVKKTPSELTSTPSVTARPSDPGPIARFIPKFEEYEFVDVPGDQQDLVDSLLKRFNKVLKSLFRSYAATGFARKKESDFGFESLGQRKDLLSESEMIKLFSDHGMVPKVISKEEIRTGVKLYCQQVMRQTEGKELDFTGFLFCFCQFAYCIFSREPYDYAHLHPFVSVRSLIDCFRMQTKAAGLNTELYDVPDPGAGDKDIAKRLTEQLATNPRLQLPQGYIKLQEPDCRLIYAVPKCVPMPKSQSTALEILDSIVTSQFDLHLLEPQVEFFTVWRVVGVKPKKEHVSLPPIYERRQSELKQKIKDHAEDLIPKERPRGANVLTPVLKLEVARCKDSDRDRCHECALLLSDLIHSVSLNSSKVVQRDDGKLKKAVTSQASEPVFLMDKPKNKEKWRVRKQELDVKMQEIFALKEKQKAEEAEKLKKQKENSDKKAKLYSEKLKKEREERDRLFKQWSEQKDEKEQKQRQEESKAKTALDERTKKIREELKRKMNEKLTEAISKRHQQWKQRSETTASPTLGEELERNKKQFSRIIQEDRKRLAEKDRQLMAFREFVKSEEVAGVVGRYRKHLELIFSLYCKQSLAKVEYDPSIFMNQMTLLELTKFTTQFGITPVIVSSDFVLNVFNSLTKMKLRDAGVPVTITYDEFVTALLRFVEAGKEYLNKMVGDGDGGLTGRTMETFCKWMGCELTLKDFHEKIKRLQLEKKHHRKLRSSGLDLTDHPAA